MHKLDFAEAVAVLTDSDPRYPADAYYFLRDGLDHAVKLRKRQHAEGSHVTGQQLCDALRHLAVKCFGPMVPTVFAYWGIGKTDDFGEMVWNLIELAVFGKTETDSRDDFRNVYSFHEAFVAPYLPGHPGRGDRKAKPSAEVRN